MQYAPERQAWINQQQEHAVYNGAAIPVEGAGTFAPPEHLPAVGSELTLNALHRVIRDAHANNGVVEEPVRDLGSSPNWNALAGGVAPEPRHSIAEDARVLSYLDRRKHEVDKAAEEVRNVFPGLIKQLSEGVKDGIQQGYIPSEVAGRLPSLDQTKIKVVDSEIIRDEAPRAFADYDVFSDEVRLGHAHLNKSEVQILIKHELMHKLAGGTFVQDPKTGKYSRTRASFSNLDRENKRIGAMESINQHVTMGTETGDFETLDPDKREDGDTTYYGGRKVVAAAVARSGGLMKTRAVTRASFEDTTPTAPATDERRGMVKESAKAYGPGAWRKIDDLAVAAEALDPLAPDFQDRLHEITSRIHAPKLNKDGTVRQQGFIDIVGLADAA